VNAKGRSSHLGWLQVGCSENKCIENILSQGGYFAIESSTRTTSLSKPTGLSPETEIFYIVLMSRRFLILPTRASASARTTRVFLTRVHAVGFQKEHSNFNNSILKPTYHRIRKMSSNNNLPGNPSNPQASSLQIHSQGPQESTAGSTTIDRTHPFTALPQRLPLDLRTNWVRPG
jgi:hypothetical protein